jgi:molybdopterin-synthase adenylyltransferase
MDRYSRHNLIDWFSQEQVSRKSICVVGAGAVGNEVIKSLVLLGVGNIDIFDFDMIEEHNLTKSVLFRSSDVGKSKAQVAANRAAELDPNVTIKGWHGDALSLLSMSALLTFDCLISCVDNFEARLRLNEMCRIANVDFINLGIDSRYASIESFPYSSEEHSVACYECNLPHSVYSRIAERYSCGHLRKISFTEKKIPTTIVTSGLAGSFGASIALRLGVNVQDSSRRILIDSIYGYSTVTTELGRSEQCPCCSTHKGPYFIIAVADNSNSNQIFNALPLDESVSDSVIRLCEPVVVSAECSTCGQSPHDGSLIGRSKNDVDETARFCSICATPSVDVSLKDELTLVEFSKIFASKDISISYATIILHGRNYCLSFEGDI